MEKGLHNSLGFKQSSGQMGFGLKQFVERSKHSLGLVEHGLNGRLGLNMVVAKRNLGLKKRRLNESLGMNKGSGQTRFGLDTECG